MKVIIQLQYSLADSRVFHDVKNITQSTLHPTQPNPPKIKNSDPTQPNPWMDQTHNQLCGGYRPVVYIFRKLFTSNICLALQIVYASVLILEPLEL